MAKVTFDFTENELKSVKNVLFGLQKQSNVTNDSVVYYVASQLKSSFNQQWSTDGEVVELIKKYLDKCINSYMGDDDELTVALIAGKQSLANIKANKPTIVVIEPISETSPKCKIRVNVLGEDPAEEDNTYEAELHNPIAKPTIGPDEVYDPSDDFATRARKIKDAILPLIPQGVKEEIPDNEYAQALCCAEYYYKL